MRFLILGPLELRSEERPVALGGIKLRALLAVLLLHANEAVSPDRIALALWGDEVSSGASKTVRAHVWRLRKALDDSELIVTTPAGYCLRVDPEEFDVAQFERLAEDGRRELVNDHPEQAATLLRQALGLWRGPALAELSCEPFAQAEIARLEEQRLAALETRKEVDELPAMACVRNAPVEPALHGFGDKPPEHGSVENACTLSMPTAGWPRRRNQLEIPRNTADAYAR